MNCYLIDPRARTVAPIEIDLNDIRAIHKAIGDKHFDIGRASVNDRHHRRVDLSLLVDDEGGLDPDNHTFSIGAAHLAGLAVVAGGNDGEGNLLAPAISLNDLKAAIAWHGSAKPIDTSFTIITW